jgi:hypothetical protein
MTAINLVDLTDANGNGIFDKLAVAMRTQLAIEFSSGRITAAEYAKVYSSSIDAVLNQSIQFLLQKDISANQADLINAQTNLAVTQEAAVQKEILLTQANIDKTIRETEILDQQELLLEAQTLLTQTQATKVEIEKDVLLIEKDKLVAETELIEAQTTQAEKQVQVLSAQLLNIPKEGILLDKQATKTDSETVFLNQRIVTEKAQILDVVDGVSVLGVLGKQKLLYQAQTDGFSRDAEQKLAKMLIDTWSVRRSTDEGTIADAVNKLNDANIGAALIKCMNSVGVTPV